LALVKLVPDDEKFYEKELTSLFYVYVSGQGCSTLLLHYSGNYSSYIKQFDPSLDPRLSPSNFNGLWTPWLN